MQDLKNKNMYAQVEAGFKNFASLARCNIKKNWKKFNKEERHAAWLGMKYIEQVAKNPAQYFSRAMTELQWKRRAAEYTRSHALGDNFSAFYIVQDPKGDVLNNSEWAFANGGDLARRFYNFCEAVQNWEYARTSKNPSDKMAVELYEKQIMELSASVKSLADIANTPVLVQPIKRFVKNFQR